MTGGSIREYVEAVRGQYLLASKKEKSEIQGTVFPYDVMIVKHEERLQKALGKIHQIRDERASRMVAGDGGDAKLRGRSSRRNS